MNATYEIKMTLRELRETRDALEAKIDSMPGGDIRANALMAHVKVSNAIGQAENTLVYQYQNSK